MHLPHYIFITGALSVNTLSIYNQRCTSSKVPLMQYTVYTSHRYKPSLAPCNIHQSLVHQSLTAISTIHSLQYPSIIPCNIFLHHSLQYLSQSLPPHPSITPCNIFNSKPLQPKSEAWQARPETKFLQHPSNRGLEPDTGGNEEYR